MLHDILLVLVGLIIGGLAGFFIAKNYMQKYFKKNPPINEKMIEVMFSSMGRKPSQKQIKETMRQMNRFM